MSVAGFDSVGKEPPGPFSPEGAPDGSSSPYPRTRSAAPALCAANGVPVSYELARRTSRRRARRKSCSPSLGVEEVGRRLLGDLLTYRSGEPEETLAGCGRPALVTERADQRGQRQACRSAFRASSEHSVWGRRWWGWPPGSRPSLPPPIRTLLVNRL